LRLALSGTALVSIVGIMVAIGAEVAE